MNYLEAKQKTLGDVVLAPNRQFIVPLNQRPWAWQNAADVQHFLNDFEKTLWTFFDPNTSPKWKERSAGRPQPPHFFGTFVFYEKNPNEWEIFDGQQRLTTVLMLCAVLREVANDAWNEPGSHQESVGHIYGWYDHWLIPPSNLSPRLCPNTFFEELYKALIFDPLDDNSREKRLKDLSDGVLEHAVTKKLKNSFYHIRTWVRKNTDPYPPSDVTEYLRASYDVLNKFFSCIETRITDEPYSYEVFGCLNARGKLLSAGDNLKNDLFTASAKPTHEDISKKWHAIGENVLELNIGEFLRRRHIALIAPCTKKNTHQQIKREEIDKNGKKIGTLINNWHKDSVRLRRILERSARLANEETLNRLRDIFRYLKVGLACIPIFAAAKRFLPDQKDNFEKCVRMIEVFVFRTLTIQRVKTSELEEKLGEAAREITNKGTVAALEKYLKTQLDDTQFETAFAKYAVRRVKVQYYILRELEIYLMGKGRGIIPAEHHREKIHIEHILPKRLSNETERRREWLWARNNPEKHRNLVNRLGNLLIIEADINQEISNHEFSVKQNGKNKNGKIKLHKCFQQSDLKSPKLIGNQKITQWTEKEIVSRQDKMARLALKVWTI